LISEALPSNVSHGSRSVVRDAALSFRRRPHLKREIVLVLAVKLLALLLIWGVWFAHPLAPRLTAETVKQALYSLRTVAQEGTDAHPKP
jgi:hypothetical protein